MTNKTIHAHSGKENAQAAYRDVQLDDVREAGEKLHAKAQNLRTLNTTKRAVQFEGIALSEIAGWTDEQVTSRVVGLGKRAIPFLDQLLVTSRRASRLRSKRSQ